MIGFHFTKHDPNEQGKSKFDQLLDVFMQLLGYTNGDVGEALQWMNQLDREYKLTGDEYGMGDFVEDLKDKGYIDENKQTGEIAITPKAERVARPNTVIPGRPARPSPESMALQNMRRNGFRARSFHSRPGMTANLY